MEIRLAYQKMVLLTPYDDVVFAVEGLELPTSYQNVFGHITLMCVVNTTLY